MWIDHRVVKNQARMKIEFLHEYRNKVRIYKKEEHELLPGQFFSDEPGVYIEVLCNTVFIFCQHLVYVVFFKWFTMSLQPG